MRNRRLDKRLLEEKVSGVIDMNIAAEDVLGNGVLGVSVLY